MFIVVKCRMVTHTHTHTKKGSCPIQTPYLVNKSHVGYSYACGLDTKILGELWNAFNCASDCVKQKKLP
jgi:hypothetical protein